MNRIVSIIVLVCLSSACDPSDERSSQLTVQADAPANAWRPEKTSTETLAPPVPTIVLPQTEGTQPGGMPAETAASRMDQGLALGDKWPSGDDMKAMAEDFMTAGFMKESSSIGFGDMAYSSVFLDFSLNGHGRIDQVNGVLRDMYDRFSFGIPVVSRGVDAVTGSRQVNWEDVIVQLESNRWRIQPVSRKGAVPFEVVIGNSIEFKYGNATIQINKSDSVFTCEWTQIGVEGQVDTLLSWTLGQFERGPVQVLQSEGDQLAEVPVIMVWEPDFITGYLVSLPGGQAEYVHRLTWVPSGDLETDRYNFLVLLTQHRGEVLRIPDSFGAVDPVWLALLMYDHVVTP